MLAAMLWGSSYGGENSLNLSPMFYEKGERNVENPEYAIDGDTDTYSRVDCTEDTEESIRYYGWDGAPELEEPDDGVWVNSLSTFSLTGGFLQDSPDLYVLYSATGTDKSEYEIKATTDSGSSFFTLVKSTEVTDSEVLKSSQTLSSGQDFAELEIRINTEKDETPDDKFLRVHEIATEGEFVSDADVKYEVQFSSVSAVFTKGVLNKTVEDTDFSIEELSGGATYWWRARMRDENMNYTGWSSTRSVRHFESPEPVFPEDGEWVSSDVELEWDPGEQRDSDEIRGYEYELAENEKFNPIDVSGFTESKQVSVENPEESTYYWRVRAEDNDGIYSDWSSPWSFRVDDTPPEVEIIEPEEESEFAVDVVTVSWSASDDLSGLNKDEFEVSTDGEEWDVADSTWSHTFEGLPEGENELYVKAKDNVGNKGDKSVSVEIIMELPEVEITSPEAEETFYEDRVTVKWETTPGSDELDRHEAQVDKEGWEKIGEDEVREHTFEGLSEGRRTLKIRAVDTGERHGEDSVEVRIDTDLRIEFREHFPPSDEWQDGISVEMKVRAVMRAPEEVKLATETAGFKVYQGTEVEKVHEGDASLYDISDDGRDAFFRADFDKFKPGENNFVRWYCEDSEGNYWSSGILHRIRIKEDPGPFVRIVQPPHRGFSSEKPVIEAEISDRSGVDPESIELMLYAEGGEEILSVSGSEKPGIYDPQREVLEYRYDGEPLESEREYSLKVSAKNKGYGEYAVRARGSADFTVRSGEITSLIPYPSPFNPERENLSVRYVLSESASVTVNIYDSGRSLVKNLVSGEDRKAGQNEEEWDGRNLAGKMSASGIYYIEVIAEGRGESRQYRPVAVYKD